MNLNFIKFSRSKVILNSNFAAHRWRYKHGFFRYTHCLPDRCLKQAFCLDAFTAPWNPKSADFSGFCLEFWVFSWVFIHFLMFWFLFLLFLHKNVQKFTKKCRLFRIWAWVFSYFLEFWVFSPWVFLPKAKNQACQACFWPFFRHLGSNYMPNSWVFCLSFEFFSLEFFCRKPKIKPELKQWKQNQIKDKWNR